jgi:hypothetical protein
VAVVVVGLVVWLVSWAVGRSPADDPGSTAQIAATADPSPAAAPEVSAPEPSPASAGLGEAIDPNTATGAADVPPVVSGQVAVTGNQAWTDSAVACRPGLSLELIATGTVFHDPTHAVGPDGASDPALHQFNLPGLATANHGTLVLSLDRKQPFTVVGSVATYACLAQGELFLGPNDAGVDNNHGEWTVTVTPSD